MEILGYTKEYNPYYQEEIHKFKRDPYDPYTLDYLDFGYDLYNNDEDYKKEHYLFIVNFQKFEYEYIFRENMDKFFELMVNKIKDISSFDTIIDLIQINKICRVNEYIRKLKNKYEIIIKPEIEQISKDKLKKPVEIIAKFAKLIFEQEGDINFLLVDVNKLSIRYLIYNELIKLCKGDKYKIMKDYIFSRYLNNIKNIDNIIIFIDNLEKNDKEKFLKELMKKCKFTKDEFYKAEENDKINLLCVLYENKKLERIPPEIETTLNEIFEDLDHEIINKKKLEEFFENKEEVIKKRLELIKLIINKFDPINSYDSLKKTLYIIKKDIESLSKIKKLLSIFQRETFRDQIRLIGDYINKLEKIGMREYKNDMIIAPIKRLQEDFETRAKYIDLVKDFLLFQVIYENTKGINSDIRFHRANEKMLEIKNSFVEEEKNFDEIYEKNKLIFDEIRKKLANNKQKTYEFLKTFELFISGKNKQLMDDLTLFFNSTKYEFDLKCIFFFFHCLNKEDEWYKNLIKKYEKLSEKNLEEIKLNLEQLKKEGIYDYEKMNNYFKLFTFLYEKEEAIIFLNKKINQDTKKFIEELSNKLEPNNLTLTVEKIYDTGKCLEVFKQFQIKKNNKEIFEYIKNLSPKQINAFESYSKIFSSIIELERNENLYPFIFDKVDKIIKNAKFIFLPEMEIFSYDENNIITMDELIHLKNKINIYPYKEKNELLNEKYEKLLTFKRLVINTEKIYENMQYLRTKGNDLPINIKIIIKYYKKKETEYYLDQKESSFDLIEQFLLNAKDDYSKQLDAAYKYKKHLRYFYGKLFKKLLWYLDGGSFDKIVDIFRYILNKNNDEDIKQGRPENPKIKDYVKYYSECNTYSFKNMYIYLLSLFEANNTSLKEEYEKILIIKKNKFKGIYLHECEENSTGEFIYELFLKKIGKTPIAQNIIICSKETSVEEIQAFIYRAILCEYNTLFVVELNESFSDYQQNIMNNYIEELLKYKFAEHNKTKERVRKKCTYLYLDACIVFIYERRNRELSLVNELGKYEKQDIELNNYELEENKMKEIIYSNIIVFTSEKCGLGKSFKIRKIIETKKQKYFYFNLGGILTKNIISSKLLNLLKIIREEKDKTSKNEKEEKKIKYAIHLDLMESEETCLINEFLFSFLIVKFYTDKETIIYIPKDIEIYIEIPNCFKDYLSQFKILNLFPKEIITLENKPKLELTQEKLNIFDRMLGLKTNEEIEEKFLKKYMKNYKNYSYYQINIFIKLFISQFSKFDCKLQFAETNEKGEIINDNTDELIIDFAKNATYFLVGGFQNLIMMDIDEENLRKENKDLLDLLSEAYVNDLRGKKFDIPLIFINKEKKSYRTLKIDDVISNTKINSKDYLTYMKRIFNIENEVEEEKNGLKSLLSILDYHSDNYEITNEIFPKMSLLAYRILADIPIIIMGEPGCGKTACIIKLSQLLNNGEIMVEIINIHPGTTDEYLCQKMEEMNEKAKKQEKELWVFFDEINTCLSLSLLKEIFVNKTFNTKQLNKNIRLIGACNPYRKNLQKIEICGYERETEDHVDLIYQVQPLPQSLLNFVYSFGALNPEEEKKYIYIIIKNLFKEGEEKLHEATKEVIFNCHKFLKEAFDTSVVSLREISRFIKIVEFFKKYFSIKRKCEEKKEDNDLNNENKEKFDKIISIISSVYLCYYIKLIDVFQKSGFQNSLQHFLIKLVNSVNIPLNIKLKDTLIKSQSDESDEINNDNISSIIENEYIKYYTQKNKIKFFSDFLSLEEQYLIDKIELPKGIGKNDILKKNLFLTFVAANTKIPLIIEGKPGTGKSLCSQLIYNSMRGKFSKNEFFREFPKILVTYYQGSESTSSVDIEKLFDIAENKLNFYKNKEEYKNKLPISMILLDELGLIESNNFKVFHSKLEYSGNGVSFIGLSNYSLESNMMINRAIILRIPNLEERIDDLIQTTNSIVESISEELKYDKIFEILSRTYFEYKRKLKLIKELNALKEYNLKVREIDKRALFDEIKIRKEYKHILRKEKKIILDFHSNIDFYYLIRGIALRIDKLDSFYEDEVQKIINDCIERNFGGIEYEIDIDSNLEFDDIRRELNALYEILKEKIEENKKDKRPEKNKNKNIKLKINSVFLFKKLYNIQCDEYNEKALKLSNKKIIEYDLNKCIISNIFDLDSRYLLLEISPALRPLIIQSIKIQTGKDIIILENSPFKEDNNNKEYLFNKIIEIQSNTNKDKLLIIQNFYQIQPFLYNLYNKNYIIKNEEKYVRICFDNFNESLTQINESFKIIILVDRKIMNLFDLPFLNRLEKMKITGEKYFNNEQIILSKKIVGEIGFKKYIDNYKINYSLRDLLINCGRKEILGLIHYEMMKNNNKYDEEKIKEMILHKLVKISSQDIISILPEGNILKDFYIKEKKYYNLKSYIRELNEHCPKISIIYTFDSISCPIEGVINEMKNLISKIESENELDLMIKEIKYRNNNISSLTKKRNIIYISFVQFNSNKIQYVSDIIKKNYKENKEDNYKFIFIVHIQRRFNSKEKNKIYSLLDVDPDIEQLFIDNLNVPEIHFEYLLKKPIEKIISDNSEYINLNDEFNKILESFIYKELNEKKIQEKDNLYYTELMKYMESNPYLKEKIINKAMNLISEEINMVGTRQILIDKILKNNYINKNSKDIISCIFNYIKEEIFNKYIKYILSILEDNNVLTSLIEIQNDQNNEIDNSIIRELIENLIENIIYDENKEFNPKFLYNYKIPGFFNSYKDILHYIKNNIALDYLNLEKNLRKYDSKINVENSKNEFIQKEKEILSSLYDYLSNEEKFFFNNLEKGKIKHYLILKDFITFYLEEYNLKNETNNNLIELLLNLRFNPEKNNLIKEYIKDPKAFLLLKMIWIISNSNYILNIFDIFSHAENIYDKDKFLEMVKNKINSKNENIKYIINEKRNPEYTKEVNEGYYILLASICFCLTSDGIELTEDFELDNNNKIGIDQYLQILKKINLNLQYLNNYLNISLNEMYIIDELIAVIELQKIKTISINKINKIRKLLCENALIIQKYQDDKFSELIVNFENIYQILNEEKIKEVKTEEDKYYEKKFYDTLKYICLQEIKKIIDLNYRNKIFEKILSIKELIKRSQDILEILLKKTIRTTLSEKDGFIRNLSNLKKGNEIVNFIENKLKDCKEDNYLAIQETILSFFEKSSLIYLNNVLNDESSKFIDEGIPLDIFEDCVKFLYIYNFTEKLNSEIRHIRKLFCIGYIKVYCNIFIEMINTNNPKLKDPLSLEYLLENLLSDKEKKMGKIIKLYIYKTIFNKNGKVFDVFLDRTKTKMYKFDKYEGFKDFYKLEEDKNINYGFESLDNDFDSFFNKIEIYKKKEYDKKINKDEIINSNEPFIDNFLNTSIILILSKLKQKEYELSDEYENYYKNICKPLFEDKPKLSKLIEFLFNRNRLEELQKHGFDNTNIESIFFSLRYSFNCLNALKEDENSDKIYSALYNKNKINYLKEKRYPGCNPKYEPKYELYNKIINHFKFKQNEGCYLCLCEKGFYQSIQTGFPGYYEKNMKCPNCGKHIGSICIEDEKEKIYKIINRKDYIRIFKDEDEINKIKKLNGKNKKLKEINYMTIEQFKEKYINKLYNDEKGLHKIEENYFKKNDKLVRNLSQISYRLLNYILYSNLFFAKLYAGESKNFDECLPEKKNYDNNSFIRMSWGETINECWILLKKELSEKEIYYPEIFMNLIFKELYTMLNKENCLNDFKSLIAFENNLEVLIQKKIAQSKEECKKYKELINKNCNNKDSFVNLLTEKFDKSNYNNENYPNYENFYYSDYLEEENVGKILEHLDKERYLVLNKYLIYAENKRNARIKKKKDNNIKDYYSLDNLYLFINVLNLYDKKYSHLISREKAENIKIEDDEIYRQNTKEVDKFIKFFNDLEKNEKKDKKDCLKINAKYNYISDLFLDTENKYGVIYKKILQGFIKRQNNELSYLLEQKIKEGKIDVNSTNRINIQQIKEDEIFTFNISKEFSFIKEIFYYSYRKLIDNNNYEKYNEYVIDFDSLEERLTNLFLKNKKLLNDDIIEFSYSNEIFTNEISNVLNKFKDNYEQEKLTADDKEIIYEFYDTYRYNKDLHKKIILDFITLIKYLSCNKESNSSISEIIAKIKSIFSKEFLELFNYKEVNNKDDKIVKKELTVNKTLIIFEYFLEFIFREIKEDLEKYSLEFKDKKLEKKTEDKLKEFFGYKEEDDEKMDYINNKKIINKNNLAIALKWFMTLILFNEKDKEHKIKGNKKNLISYLNVADFWEKNIYNDIINFNSDLAELKKCNIQINKIIWLYDFLIEEYEEDPEEEIKEYIIEKYGNLNKNKEQEERDNLLWQSSDEEEEEELYHSREEEDNEEDDEGD